MRFFQFLLIFVVGAIPTFGQTLEVPDQNQILHFADAVQLTELEWQYIKRIATDPRQERTELYIGGKLSRFSKTKILNAYLSQTQGPLDWLNRDLRTQWLLMYPADEAVAFDLRSFRYLGEDGFNQFFETSFLHWERHEPDAFAAVWGQGEGNPNIIGVGHTDFDLENQLVQIQFHDLVDPIDPYLIILPDGSVWEPQWNVIEQLSNVGFGRIGFLEDLGEGRYRSDWFGSFTVLEGGWVHHDIYGNVFIGDNDIGSETGYWFYHVELGWMWTLPTLFPICWSDSMTEKVELSVSEEVITAQSLVNDEETTGEINTSDSIPTNPIEDQLSILIKPGVVRITEDEFNMVYSLSRRETDREELYLSGYLMHYNQEKSKNMRLSGTVGHNDHLGRDLGLQMRRIIPNYLGSLVQIVNSTEFDSFVFSAFNIFLEVPEFEALIYGRMSTIDDDNYAEYNLVGTSIQSSRFNFDAMSLTYGKPKVTDDPYFLFQPDGHFWDPGQELKSAFYLGRHADLAFLRPVEDGFFESDWFGAIRPIEGAWIEHIRYGNLWVFGNRLDNKGYIFYKDTVGWFWMSPISDGYVFLNNTAKWYQLKQVEDQYILESIVGSEIIDF